MGCLNSTPKDSRGRFRVKNLDDQNRVVGEGELEVTATHIILHQNTEPIEWPLKFLRRYGYDENLFSFEAGRRCPTGEGIYAFSTRSAEQIFRLVETNIKRRKSTDNGRDGAAPAPAPALSAGAAPAEAALPEKRETTDGIQTPESRSAAKDPQSRGLPYAELELPPASKQWRISEKADKKDKKRSGYATIDIQATEQQAAIIAERENQLNYADMDFSNQKSFPSKLPVAAEKTNYATVIPKLRDDPVSEPSVAEVLAPAPRSGQSELNYMEVSVGTNNNRSPSKPPSGSQYTQIDFKMTKALQQTAQGQSEYVNTASERQTRHS